MQVWVVARNVWKCAIVKIYSIVIVPKNGVSKRGPTQAWFNPSFSTPSFIMHTRVFPCGRRGNVFSFALCIFSFFLCKSPFYKQNLESCHFLKTTKLSEAIRMSFPMTISFSFTAALANGFSYWIQTHTDAWCSPSLEPMNVCMRIHVTVCKYACML